MEDILEQLIVAKAAMQAATTFGEELEAWAKWCKLWDKKEALEEASRNNAKGYQL